MHMHLLHILHMLTWDYRHIHQAPLLYRAYLRDHALVLLRSGMTSGSGGPGYLHWLAGHRVAPADW